MAYIEASAYIYQDEKILIEVDHLQDVPSPYLQIKGINKEIVLATGSALKLDGSYTTKSYLHIILERLPALERSSSGIHSQQAARLQELVEYIQPQFMNPRPSLKILRVLPKFLSSLDSQIEIGDGISSGLCLSDTNLES